MMMAIAPRRRRLPALGIAAMLEAQLLRSPTDLLTLRSALLLEDCLGLHMDCCIVILINLFAIRPLSTFIPSPPL